MDLASLRFPVGQFEMTDDFVGHKKNWISTIREFPDDVAIEVEGMNRQQMGWRYRPEGWTAEQVVHHCADSHMNALIRFKLGLTEDDPMIKPYEEAKWAELPDGKGHELEDSLFLLSGLHGRWTAILEGMQEDQWQRTIQHPEHDHKLTLAELLGLYDWHCRHHLAHIRLAKQQKY